MSEEALYLRIAAGLRKRIEAGELAPGDRMPSIRRIARDSGVALATATRVLAVLKEEGLVESRPRSGTVVAPTLTRPRRRAGGIELTRERIVRAGMGIADAEGLAGLTVRAVAARLGVAVAAIYRHVRGRDELIRLMADVAYGDEPKPAFPPVSRRATLDAVAHRLWRVYRRHPWLPHLTPLGRPLLLPNLIPYAEEILRAFDGLGLRAEEIMDRQVLIYSYVEGLAVHVEREAQAAAVTGMSDEEWTGTQERALGALAASGRYPNFTKIISQMDDNGYDLDLDRLFDLGLTTLLDGLSLG